MTNPCYKILTKDNVKQQIEYYRRPWYEPIIPVKVAPLEDVDVDVNVDVENKRIINHNNNNNNNNNRNIDDDDDENVLKILYIDNHIMAVHKPSGLPTMPSQTYYEYSVLNTLRRLYNNNDENDNDSDNNKNEHCKNNSVTMSSEDDNEQRNDREIVSAHCQIFREGLTATAHSNSNDNEEVSNETSSQHLLLELLYREKSDRITSNGIPPWQFIRYFALIKNLYNKLGLTQYSITILFLSADVIYYAWLPTYLPLPTYLSRRKRCHRFATGSTQHPSLMM